MFQGLNKYVLLGLIIIVGWVLFLLVGGHFGQVASEAPTVTLTPQQAVRSPGPPTVWRLVLQYKDNKVNVASALERRTEATKPRFDIARLLDRKSILLEYIGVDAEGLQVLKGYIVIPLTAVAEFQDPDNNNNLRSIDETLTDPWIKVALPFDTRVVSLDFSRVEPEAITDIALWTRTPLNRVTFSKVKRPVQ